MVCRTIGVAGLLLALCDRADATPSLGGGATPVDRGFSVTPDVVVRIYVPKGKLRVQVWDRDSIHVRGQMSDGASFFGGGSRTHVKLGVEARVASDPRLPEADWVVHIPRRTRVWVKQIDGDLEVTGTSAELEAYTVRGRMVVHDVSGNTMLESIDAPVTVQNGRGDLRVRGSKGAVVLQHVQGTVSVATVSGPVTVQAARFDGRVETIGGDVIVERPELGKAELEIQTHSGGVTLRVDPRSAPRLTLSSRAGPPVGDVMAGSAEHGQLTVRSFKGRITVQALR
ncbi:DUF4097 family beta strand repeat-containing protein [Gemmatimonas aurantiaca]|uniref:DUF4097 family beta strand repeat-containing protein n=1 Tax=Gemmatimonas aurantiaca TaxID=173480 RepID=UPI00301CC5D3